MKHKPQTLRTAILALSASIVLPTAPVFGQDAPVIAPPPPVTASPPPVMTPAPAPTPPAASPAPAPRAEAPARTTTRSTATRAAPARRAAPVRAAPAEAPAPAPAPVAEAPVAEPVAQTPLPSAETPVAPIADEGRAGAGELGGGSILPWILAGIGVLLTAFAFFAFRRRRRDDDVYEDEVHYEEPVVVEAAPEPSFVRAAAPVAPAFVPAAAAIPSEPVREIEEPEVVEAANEDVEALAAASAPVGNRPWIEFLMRPVRAGTSADDAIVQFELTVGNTGTVEAKDVRISTWMVAGGQGTDMERSLIDPPADAQVSEVDISAGDGARVEAELAVPKGNLSEPVLPVVVADARYRLPDGTEGRTHAAFEIGLPDGEDNALTPFPVDRASGLRENVEARLHGQPERV